MLKKGSEDYYMIVGVVLLLFSSFVFEEGQTLFFGNPTFIPYRSIINGVLIAGGSLMFAFAASIWMNEKGIPAGGANSVS